MTLRKAYMKLALAILFEICATTMLVASDGFTHIIPSILVIVCYGISYYILTYVFLRMHIGVAYAIWSGAGIVAVNVIGMMIFNYSLNAINFNGMLLIIAGIIIINFSSKNKNIEQL